MELSEEYQDFFTSGMSQIPSGLASGTDWRLLYANPRLEKLISPDKTATSDSLREWLKGGACEYSSDSENIDNSASGSLIFRQSSGRDYLLTWNVSPASAESTRFFTILPVSTPPLYGTDRDHLREMDSILDFIHDGIWIIDGNGITLRINRSMERIAGIKSEEVVGRHVSEPLKEGRFKTCVTLRALQTRQTVTLFDDYSNGKRCLNTSTPIFDSHGNVLRVIAAIRDITELEKLQSRLSSLEVEAMAFRLRVQGLENQTHSGLLGQSPRMARIMQDISKAAQSDAITLILGETGTGKSLAARIIHELSNRSQKPFVTVNCGAIPPGLIESELFGYEKGAFTGASRGGKPGLIELAAGGTLLLDEIGELSLPLQAKLLHLLDGQPIYRLGSTRPISSTARIIAATNQPLDKMVGEGRFREDLFYRLRVLCVDMPPLRERKDDILFLAWHFLHKFDPKKGRMKKLDPRVEQLFLSYAWPGNVRELQSVIQSLVTLCERELITPADLPSYINREEYGALSESHNMQNLPKAIASLEEKMLLRALGETGSTYKAARRLGISQSSVARKARKYGLSWQEHDNSGNNG